jgi:hypothetical protein
LARAQQQRAVAVWLAFCFALDTSALLACLVRPASFQVVESTGAVTLAALAGLFGLWRCALCPEVGVVGAAG